MKTFACRIGRHTWTTRIEAGEEFKVCSACGKTSSGPSGARSAPPIYRGVDPSLGHGAGLERQPHD